MGLIEDKWAGEYTSSDMRAWREGDWLFAALGPHMGERLTRNRKFITARANFYGCQSPRRGRFDAEFQGFEFRVQPVDTQLEASQHYANGFDVPIQDDLTSQRNEEQ